MIPTLLLTKTFGSRVADGVYESLLDGLELEKLWLMEKVKVLHYLMVDDKFTWWDCGRSYLCRIIDMLHMGYVDEVFFGRQVLSEIPESCEDLADHNDSRLGGSPRGLATSYRTAIQANRTGTWL